MQNHGERFLPPVSKKVSPLKWSRSRPWETGREPWKICMDYVTTPRVQEMYTEVRQPNVLFPFRKNYLGKTLLALKVLLQVMGVNWSLASLYPGGHNFYTTLTRVISAVADWWSRKSNQGLQRCSQDSFSCKV